MPSPLRLDSLEFFVNQQPEACHFCSISQHIIERRSYWGIHTEKKKVWEGNFEIVCEFSQRNLPSTGRLYLFLSSAFKHAKKHHSDCIKNKWEKRRYKNYWI